MYRFDSKCIRSVRKDGNVLVRSEVKHDWMYACGELSKAYKTSTDILLYNNSYAWILSGNSVKSKKYSLPQMSLLRSFSVFVWKIQRKINVCVVQNLQHHPSAHRPLPPVSYFYYEKSCTCVCAHLAEPEIHPTGCCVSPTWQTPIETIMMMMMGVAWPERFTHNNTE